jgi:hypothetical protein
MVINGAITANSFCEYNSSSRIPSSPATPFGTIKLTKNAVLNVNNFVYFNNIIINVQYASEVILSVIFDGSTINIGNGYNTKFMDFDDSLNLHILNFEVSSDAKFSYVKDSPPTHADEIHLNAID